MYTLSGSHVLKASVVDTLDWSTLDGRLICTPSTSQQSVNRGLWYFLSDAGWLLTWLNIDLADYWPIDCWSTVDGVLIGILIECWSRCRSRVSINGIDQHLIADALNTHGLSLILKMRTAVSTKVQKFFWGIFQTILIILELIRLFKTQ